MLQWLMLVQSVIIGKKRTFLLLNFYYADEWVRAVVDSPWHRLKLTWLGFNQWTGVNVGKHSISSKRAASSQSIWQKKKKNDRLLWREAGDRQKNKIRKHNTRMMETVSLQAFFSLFLGYLFVCLTPKQQVEQKWKWKIRVCHHTLPSPAEDLIIGGRRRPHPADLSPVRLPILLPRCPYSCLPVSLSALEDHMFSEMSSSFSAPTFFPR